MLIYNPTIDGHDIRLSYGITKQFHKYCIDGKLPNKNVNAAQAEAFVENEINTAIVSTDKHIRIHLFSFPKKTEEENPLIYRLWCGPLNLEPSVMLGNTYWWEYYNPEG